MAIKVEGHFEVEGSPPDGPSEHWFMICLKPIFENGEIVKFVAPGAHRFKLETRGSRSVLYMRRLDKEDMS